MTIKIFLYAQEYDDSWPTPSGVKTRIGNLTNKYIHALNQLDSDAKVTITFSSEDGRKATDEEMDFLVQAENKQEEDKIYDVIAKVANDIRD